MAAVVEALVELGLPVEGGEVLLSSNNQLRFSLGCSTLLSLVVVVELELMEQIRIFGQSPRAEVVLELQAIDPQVVPLETDTLEELPMVKVVVEAGVLVLDSPQKITMLDLVAVVVQEHPQFLERLVVEAVVVHVAFIIP